MAGFPTRRPTTYHVVKKPSRETETTIEITESLETTSSIENEHDPNATQMTTWPGRWGRLGGLAGTSIILGTILQLGTFGFLIFLWTGRGSDPSGDKAPPVWRQIFLSGAGTRVVTVCALLIRSIVGLQATVCTGLAAALVLEARSVVDMSNAATFSILRAVNGGPVSFVTPLARTPSKLVTSVPAAVILILWLGSMAISFSSTILLSDFRTVSLLNSTTTSIVPIMEASAELVGPFGLQILGPRPGIWQQPLQSFPSFGEATVEKPSAGDGFTDTGLIKRSLIPLQTQSRKNLRSFQGASAVYTSRAGCVRPTISGKITGVPPLADTSHMMESALVSGHLTFKSQDGLPFLSGLSCGPTGSECNQLPFNCSLPFAYVDSNKPILPRLPTSLCNLVNYPPQFIPNEATPTMFLVFDTDIDTDHWAGLVFDPATETIDQMKSFIPLPKQSSSQEWAVMSFGDQLTLNATLCLLNSTLTLEHVSLSSTADAVEPEIQYNASTNAWSTDAIVNMTDGTRNASYVSRGIMSLDTWSDVSPAELDSMYARSINYNPSSNSTSVMTQFVEAIQKGVNTNDLTIGYDPGNFSIYVCGVCSAMANPSWETHPYISLVFHAVANRTESMAQALHATFFWLYQSQYTSAIPGFDMGDNSTMTWSAEASVPVAHTGIIVVGVLVLLHLLCVFTMAGMFLWRTHWSMFGNVWHAVAQIVAGPEMRLILEDATATSDDEIAKKLEAEGIRSVKVGLWDQGGRRLAVASGADYSTGV
ncbi:hypothetical protein V8C35DRAFT_303092 [Trichoderma chlorosporum]